MRDSVGGKEDKCKAAQEPTNSDASTQAGRPPGIAPTMDERAWEVNTEISSTLSRAIPGGHALSVEYLIPTSTVIRQQGPHGDACCYNLWFGDKEAGGYNAEDISVQKQHHPTQFF